MQAACYGHLTCVFLLLQSGADVNMKNRWGCDALVAAAQGGFDTVVQVRERERERETREVVRERANEACVQRGRRRRRRREEVGMEGVWEFLRSSQVQPGLQ